MDNVRLFNRTLTTAEITVLYNEVSRPNPVDFFKDNSGILQYSFEGNLNDTGGLYNATTPDSIGYSTDIKRFGSQSLDDGTDGKRIRVNTGTKTVRTISMWCNSVANTHDYVYLWHNANAYFVYYNDSRHSYMLNNCRAFRDGVEIQDGDAVIYDDGVWHHYVCIINDGVDISDLTIANNNESTSDDKRSGIGYYDNVRMFDRALTIAEINALGTEITPNSRVDYFRDNSALALYEFDGNLDDSNNLNDAVALAGTVTTTDGTIGTGSIDLTSSSAIKGATITVNGIKTISFWFKVINPSNTYNTFFSFEPEQQISANHKFIALYDNATKYTINKASATVDGVDVVMDTPFVNDNKWHHCVVTFDTPTDTIMLGNLYPTQSIDYNGNCYIDQVRIFNKSLDANEVIELKAEGATSTTVDVFGDGSAIALYEFDTNLNDTGGVVNASTTNSTGVVTTEHYLGTGSLDMVNDSGIKEIAIDTGSANVKTISFWAKVDHLSTSYNIFTSYNPTPDDSSNHVAFLINDANANYLVMKCTGYVDGESSPIEHDVTPSKPLHEWHHFVIEYDTPMQTFTIGNTQSDLKVDFNGNSYIDQVRLFNRALTLSERQQLMNEH